MLEGFRRWLAGWRAGQFDPRHDVEPARDDRPALDVLASFASVYGRAYATEPRSLPDTLRALPARDWPRLPVCCRPWIRAREVAPLEREAPVDAVELLGFASLSQNGHAREAALRALERLGHPRGVPYALLRLGDWVPEVRGAAERALDSLLDRGAWEQLVRHHRLVERLPGIGRVDLAPKSAELRAALAANGSAAVRAGLSAENAGTRRFCFDVLREELPRDAELRAAALRDPDPAVRRWLARGVASGGLQLPGPALVSLLRDRNGSVSAPVILSLSLESVARHRELLIELAFADAQAVREAARHALLRDEAPDLAALGRARLAREHDSPRPGVVAGLGEVGDAKDLAPVAALLGHRRPRVRSAAATACARLDPEGAPSRLAPLLADPSGRVRRAAVALLRRSEHGPWRTDARRIQERGTPGARSAALKALTARGGWDAVPALLVGIVDPSEELRDKSWHQLARWYAEHSARGWLRPSRECLAELSRDFERARRAARPPGWAADRWHGLVEWIDQVLEDVGPVA